MKVLGLPRAGTNYLAWLLRRNFDVELHHRGWVHGFPHERWHDGKSARRMRNTLLEEVESCIPILIYKDRGRWLASIERCRPARAQISDRWGIEADYDLLYEMHMAAWAPHVRTVRYGSIVSDPIAGMRYLATLVESPALRFETPVKVPESPEWKPEDAARYR